MSNLTGNLKNNKIATAALIIALIVASFQIAGFVAPRQILERVADLLESEEFEQAIFDVLQVHINSSYSLLAKTATFFVTKINTYFCLGRGNDSTLLSYNTNGNLTLQYAVNNASGGGSVYVSVSNYSNSTITVPDGVRLTIEKGAVGITASAGASATCLNEDYNSGLIRYYASGVLSAQINLATGETTLVPSWQSAWDTTVQDVIQAYSAMAWKSGWNATVANIVETAVLSWNPSWTDDVNALIAGASILWSQITSANTTVQEIVDAYSAMAWKSGWNTTILDIIENNELSSLLVSGVVTAGGIELTVGVLPGAPSYTVYPAGANYVIKHANGTVCWQSTNASAVWFATIGNCSDGDSIFIKKGTYTVNNSWTDGGKNNIKLELDIGTQIVAAANFDNILLWLSDVTGWRIIGGDWNGNQANQPTTTNCAIIKMDNGCSNCTVAHATLHDCKIFGVWITEGSSNCGAIDCNIYQIGYNGIQLGGAALDCVHLFAYNNRVWDCGDIGIQLQSNFSSAFNNHVWDMNSYHADWLTGHNGMEIEGGSFCTLQGNIIENTEGNGIIVRGSNHNIHGNTLNNTDNDGSWQASIYCNSMNGSKIDGNIIVQRHSGTTGIHLEGGSDSNTIIGNYININGNAIILSAGSDLNWVIGNDMRGSSAGVSDSGAGNIISLENLGA